MSDTPVGAPPSGGAPRALGSILDWVLNLMNSIGSGWIFVLMTMICVDATGRTLFTHPFNGVNEMVEMSIVGIVFMQLGDATRRGRLTRSDGFYNLINRRWPSVWRVQAFIFEMLGVAFFVIILFGAIPELIDAWTLNYFVGEVGLFTFPEWPIKLVIALGCFVTLLQFFRIAWRIATTGSVLPPEDPSKSFSAD